ncbi:MAG: hypothetical protein IPN34_22490 [Planctomycetes bacterium]|nr:hypothetical protein [Planctomycetota bacterium]
MQAHPWVGRAITEVLAELDVQPASIEPVGGEGVELVYSVWLEESLHEIRVIQDFVVDVKTLSR